jgi:hypothetical protein
VHLPDSDGDEAGALTMARVIGASCFFSSAVAGLGVGEASPPLAGSSLCGRS